MNTSHLPATLEALRAAPLDALPSALLDRFTQQIPKVDLHCHLEGAITPEVWLATRVRHPHMPLPADDYETLRSCVQMMPSDEPSLKSFLTKFGPIGATFLSREVIRDLTEATVLGAAQDNVRHLELRCAPDYMAAAHGLPLTDVVAGVLEGIGRASQASQTTANLTLIVERHRSMETAWAIQRLAVESMEQGVVALDLANNEVDFAPGPFAPVFQAARKAGLHVTVHAGECGKSDLEAADNIRVAIHELAAERIGHGIAAAHDPDVEELLRALGIPLEMNYTSNLQTRCVAHPGLFPLRRFLSCGVITTLNTDDPGIEGITLSGDLARASRDFGLSIDELQELARNAVRASFLVPQDKHRLSQIVEEGFARATLQLADSLNPEELRRLAHAGLRMRTHRHEELRLRVEQELASANV